MDKHDYNPHLVKAARVQAGFIRQEDAAVHLGCSRKLVSESETGFYVSYEWLKRFASLYNVPVKDWLYDTGNATRSETPSTEKILTDNVT